MMRPHSLRLVAALAALLSLPSCADDTGFAPGEMLPVLVTAKTVAVGVPIDVVSVNPGHESFSYGACSMAVERRTLSGWQRYWPAFGGACIAVAYGLGPGVQHTFRLPAVATAGEYRITFDAKESDSERLHRVLSAEFVVPPVPAASLGSVVPASGASALRP
jgi:hypothetical protein